MLVSVIVYFIGIGRESQVIVGYRVGLKTIHIVHVYKYTSIIS